uniref:Uncharacterized protein n=1 Tax=Arundo donax TaxID=35708 RepID=A0A0A9BGF1_ARUDO
MFLPDLQFISTKYIFLIICLLLCIKIQICLFTYRLRLIVYLGSILPT